MKIKVSNYISQFLIDNGITDCFMVTGGGAMHLDDALGHQKGMNCIFNHHEQASAIAAEAYARMTGKIAAVCVTSGPGGTNAITGVIGGWLDSIPMFILSGQVKRETTLLACEDLKLRQLGDQEFDIVHSVNNMTKYAHMVTEPEEIAYHLQKALYLAYHGRKGPVWLDIPLDVQGSFIDTDELKHFDPISEDICINVKSDCNDSLKKHDIKNEAELDKQTDIVIDRLAHAKSPVLLVGTGIHLSGAEQELLDLLELLQIPIVTAWNANDLIAYDNPYFAGMPGTVGTRPGNFVVQNSDLLISIGCRLNIRMIGYNHGNFAQDAYKIIVDIDEDELLKPTIKPDLPICADAKLFINKLLSKDYKPHHDRWLKWCKELLVRYPVTLKEYYLTDELNPYVFVDKLFDSLRNDDRIICGNGSACVMTFQAGKIKQGQRMFTNSGCAAMGYGLPAALGVAVSDNTRRTVCIDGDGSVMMNIQELATIAHNKLNVKLFILNNNGYHSIRQTQTNLFSPPLIGVDAKSGISFPDFETLSRAFGIGYYRIDSIDSFDELIDGALQGDEPCICEVIVDPKQNFAPKSASRVLEDGRIVSTSLEDMAPFLERDELKSIRFEY